MKSEQIVIPADVAAKCNGPDQAERFDAGVRAFLSVPKSAVLESEARAKRRKNKMQRPA